MNSISIDIKDMLVAETDMEFKKQIFINNLPGKPMNCLSIYDTSGSAPDTTLDRFVMENPTVQIIIRNSNYVSAYTVANQIKEVLHAKANELWNDTFYQSILLMSGPTTILGQQTVSETKAGETIISMNFIVKRNKKIN